jgi:hypothetical protein
MKLSVVEHLAAVARTMSLQHEKIAQLEREVTTLNTVQDQVGTWAPSLVRPSRVPMAGGGVCR